MFYIATQNGYTPLLQNDRLNNTVFDAEMSSEIRYFNSVLSKLSNMSGNLDKVQRTFVEIAVAFNIVNYVKFKYNNEIPFTFTDEEITKVRQAVSQMGYILAGKIYESSVAVFDVNEVRKYVDQIFRRRLEYFTEGFGTETELLDFLVKDEDTWFYLEENESLHRTLIEINLINMW